MTDGPATHPAGSGGADPADEVPPDKPWFDSTDLRTGAFFNDDALALLPLVGVWRGTGNRLIDLRATAAPSSNEPPFSEPVSFAQQITFAHNGGRFLSYDEYQWLLDEDGGWLADSGRECGFWRLRWRPQYADSFVGPVDPLKIAVATSFADAQYFAGHAGNNQWLVSNFSEDLENDVDIESQTTSFGEETRFYEIKGDTLTAAVIRPQPDGSLLAWQMAKLTRVYTAANQDR